MSQEEKNKNIFQQAKDALSSKDEQAALEAAQKQIKELEQRAVRAEQQAAQNAQKQAAAELRANQTAQKLAEAERQVTQLKADFAKAQTELNAAKGALTSFEQRLGTANSELQRYRSAAQAEQSAEAAAAVARAQTIADHTVKADETLSHLAQKYYGSAGEAYWRLIYEANKAVIGDNPGRVRPGMVLKIPVLPDSMKKK